MQFEILIVRDNTVLARASGSKSACLTYHNIYCLGDMLVFKSADPGYYWVQLEDTLPPLLAYFAGKEFRFPVPFGEKKICYSPKCFTGDNHFLAVRLAKADEVSGRRNLAFNPLDHHDNTSLYPHARANVETRDEACFAAHNAIDGRFASEGHGQYPYGSWGINRRDDAEITIYFGRDVCVDELVLTLRADFPHDNWWQQVDIIFSDSSRETLKLIKTGERQHFCITPRTVNSVTMCNLQKDPSDPSPFPALRQLEVWGYDCLNLNDEGISNRSTALHTV